MIDLTGELRPLKRVSRSLTQHCLPILQARTLIAIWCPTTHDNLTHVPYDCLLQCEPISEGRIRDFCGHSFRNKPVVSKSEHNVGINGSCSGIIARGRSTVASNPDPSPCCDSSNSSGGYTSRSGTFMQKSTESGVSDIAADASEKYLVIERLRVR